MAACSASSRPTAARRRARARGRRAAGQGPRPPHWATVGAPADVHAVGTYDRLLDPYGDWASVREVHTSGCVLVRPDRHIAWCSLQLGSSAAEEHTAALGRAVGRNSAAITRIR